MSTRDAIAAVWKLLPLSFVLVLAAVLATVILQSPSDPLYEYIALGVLGAAVVSAAASFSALQRRHAREIREAATSAAESCILRLLRRGDLQSDDRDLLQIAEERGAVIASLRAQLRITETRLRAARLANEAAQAELQELRAAQAAPAEESRKPALVPVQ